MLWVEIWREGREGEAVGGADDWDGGSKVVDMEEGRRMEIVGSLVVLSVVVVVVDIVPDWEAMIL